MGKGHEQTFLKRRHISGQQIDEQMLIITTHQRNTNQNHNEMPSHTSQNGHNQKAKKQQMLVRLWRKGNTYTLLMGCKLVQPLWKAVWRLLKEPKTELPFNPAIPLLGIFPKENKLFYLKDTFTRMFIVVLFPIAKTWNQPRCPSTEDWINKKWCTYTTWNTTQS